MKQIITIQSWSADPFAPTKCLKTQLVQDLIEANANTPHTLLKEMFQGHVNAWLCHLRDQISFGVCLSQFVWDTDTGTMTPTGNTFTKFMPAKEKKVLNAEAQVEKKFVPKYTINSPHGYFYWGESEVTGVTANVNNQPSF